MPSVEESIRQISNLIRDIAEGMPDIVQTVALTAIAKEKERIQQRGLDSEEVSFQPYSDSYKKRKAKKRGAEAVTHVNLTDTGDMFRRLGIIRQSAGNKGEYLVTIGGRTDFAQDKIDWNSIRYGNILQPTKKEEEELKSTAESELDEIFKRNGF